MTRAAPAPAPDRRPSSAATDRPTPALTRAAGRGARASARASHADTHAEVSGNAPSREVQWLELSTSAHLVGGSEFPPTSSRSPPCRFATMPRARQGARTRDIVCGSSCTRRRAPRSRSLLMRPARGRSCMRPWRGRSCRHSKRPTSIVLPAGNRTALRARQGARTRDIARRPRPTRGGRRQRPHIGRRGRRSPHRPCRRAGEAGKLG
jgi:hypothetical protein